MLRRDLGVYLAVISSGRPARAAQMAAHIGMATWYVGADEAGPYREVLGLVIEAGDVIAARNRALDDAFALDGGMPCLQISDDLAKIERAFGAGADPISFSGAVSLLARRLAHTPYKLAGVAPTANEFFYNPTRTVGHRAFIVGDLFLALPSAPRFDPAIWLKEDYDFTLQHLSTYGGVARCNDLLATFAHRTNKGGAVSKRTPALEQEMIARLKAKWPGCFRDNPRRPNEILLKPPAGRVAPPRAAVGAR